MKNKMKNRKHPSWLLICEVLIFTGLINNAILFPCFASGFDYDGVHEGQVLIWKFENTEGTSFLKANITFVNETLIKADQYEYNKFAIKTDEQLNTQLSLIIPNYSYNFMILYFGNNNETKTIAGREVNVFIYNTTYNGSHSEIYYDFQTGLLVYSETSDGDETNITSLVSWRDDDIANYANLYPIIIGAALGAGILIVLIRILVKKKKKSF